MSPPEEPPAWVLLPAEERFVLPVADTRSPLSRIIVHGVEGAVRLDTGIGADFPIVEWRTGRLAAQLGLEAGVFMDFDAGGEFTFDLMTFDGRFGLPLDLATGPWSARIEVAHMSAHWGDGVRQGDERPDNLDGYSREFLSVLGARELGPVRVYAGGRALLHRSPEVDPWAAQVGGEVWGPWVVTPYAAVDLVTAGEFAWRPQLGAQLGAAVPMGARRLRIAAVAHLGPDDTGKREGAPENYLGALFGFDATGGLRRAGETP